MWNSHWFHPHNWERNSKKITNVYPSQTQVFWKKYILGSKGKVALLQARLWRYSSKTSALEGVSGQLHFTPGKVPLPIVQEAGWAPGPVWTGGKSRSHRDSIPVPFSVSSYTELPGPHFRERGHAVAQLVEALRYKPEGRGFDSRWCNWIFSLT